MIITQATKMSALQKNMLLIVLSMYTNISLQNKSKPILVQHVQTDLHFSAITNNGIQFRVRMDWTDPSVVLGLFENCTPIFGRGYGGTS